MIERSGPIISSIRNALECKLAAGWRALDTTRICMEFDHVVRDAKG
jgi:hypothetical protein